MIINNLKKKIRMSQYNLISTMAKMSGKMSDKITLIKDVSLLEQLNSNLSINIYAVCEEDKTIFPFRLSSNVSENVNEINLLLLYDIKSESYHYCLIKKLLPLVRKLNSYHNGTRFKNVCRRCLLLFTCAERYAEHMTFCITNQSQVIKLPKDGENIQKFKNLANILPLSFIVYFDFETFTPVVSSCDQFPEITIEERKYSWMRWVNEIDHVTDCKLCSEMCPCSDIRPTKNFDSMIAYSYGMQLSCIEYDLYSYELHLFSSSNEKKLMRDFLVQCRWNCSSAYSILTDIQPMELSLADQLKADTTFSCRYCQRDFDFRLCRPVLDHNHLTGRFR